MIAGMGFSTAGPCGSATCTVFDTMPDYEYDEKIQSAIQQSVSQWMPFLTISVMDIQRYEDRNKTVIKVSFILNNDETKLEIIVVEI